MSTNYYLVSKNQSQIKQQLDKIILQPEINKLKSKLLSFSHNYNLNIEAEINDKINTISNELYYGIYEPDKIHICKVSRILTWQVNEYYNTIDKFITFYTQNKDKYYIIDEYGQKVPLNKFIKRIYHNISEINYEHGYFS
jgi:hypothetical protein